MIAFYLPGGLPIYAFSVILGIGATAGLAWIVWQAPIEARRQNADLGLLVLLGGLVGGRLFFAVMHWSYYQDHLEEIPQIYLGGMAWTGVLFGGLLTLIGFIAFRNISFARNADVLFPLAVCLVVAAWLGCWVDGCAYGNISNSWWSLPARDEGGLIRSRLPLQIVGALMAACTFWLMDVNRDKLKLPGMLAALGGFILIVEYFILSFWRVDPAPHWLGLRLDTWFALILLVVAGLLLIYLTIRFRDRGLEV